MEAKLVATGTLPAATPRKPPTPRLGKVRRHGMIGRPDQLGGVVVGTSGGEEAARATGGIPLVGMGKQAAEAALVAQAARAEVEPQGVRARAEVLGLPVAMPSPPAGMAEVAMALSPAHGNGESAT
mmetsp:Transcript_19135/g.43055  ORF Transcript_19135/g.43055 Transcript_19135/m.43055 type:complete len:126 (-) Transcript_19135:91-468(-)